MALTTVGYGDFYPVSTPGRIVGAIFVLSSLGVLGLLIGKIADLFTSYLFEPDVATYTSDLLSARSEPGEHDIQE